MAINQNNKPDNLLYPLFSLSASSPLQQEPCRRRAMADQDTCQERHINRGRISWWNKAVADRAGSEAGWI